MTLYTFEEIKHSAKKTCKCTVCGKRLVRSKTFMQTLNPFNKNPDGSLKDEYQIKDELAVKAAQWKLEDEICRNCDGF